MSPWSQACDFKTRPNYEIPFVFEPGRTETHIIMLELNEVHVKVMDSFLQAPGRIRPLHAVMKLGAVHHGLRRMGRTYRGSAWPTLPRGVNDDSMASTI